MQRRLAMAGLYEPNHIALYMLSELLAPVIMFGAVFIAMGMRGIIFAVLAGILGYLLPAFVVEWYAEKRQKEIATGCPMRWTC